MRNSDQIRRGQKLETIWNHYREHLSNYVKSRIHDLSDTEDILQEVCMEIYKSPDIFYSGIDVQTLLYRLTRRVILSYYCDYHEIQSLIESHYEVQDKPQHQITCILLPVYFPQYTQADETENKI
ncbi:sigma factor [Fibrobacterota bacterium]